MTTGTKSPDSPFRADCPRCKGTGRLIIDAWPGDPNFGKTIPCNCYDPLKDAGIQNINRWLEEITPLTARERSISFEHLNILPGNRDAIIAAQALGTDKIWQLAFTGHPGRSKTTIMLAAVNYARNQGKTAAYTTFSDMLAWLRKAFNQEDEADFDTRWQRVLAADVLAVDELDVFNTDWSTIQVERLIDTRWRLACAHHSATIYATNRLNLQFLPEKAQSRLSDISIGRIISLTGNDQRTIEEGRL